MRLCQSPVVWIFCPSSSLLSLITLPLVLVGFSIRNSPRFSSNPPKSICYFRSHSLFKVWLFLQSGSFLALSLVFICLFFNPQSLPDLHWHQLGFRCTIHSCWMLVAWRLHTFVMEIKVKAVLSFPWSLLTSF